ncbi:MAG: hypothetical protein QW291_07230 [Thermofilaceae archaeon]
MTSPEKKDRKVLEDALDHIDSAIHLLHTFVKFQPCKLEEVEDIIVLLEDAGDALEKLSRTLYEEQAD